MLAFGRPAKTLPVILTAIIVGCVFPCVENALAQNQPAMPLQGPIPPAPAPGRPGWPPSPPAPPLDTRVPAEPVEPPLSIPTPSGQPLGTTALPMTEAANYRTISFSAALAAVTARNPQICIANQRIEEAYAQLQGARYLWLPAIRAGVSYNRHDGPVQGPEGELLHSDRSALEAGFGMGAVGAGSPPVPGLIANFRLADAVFLPPIAEYNVGAQRFAAQATTNDLLLAVGLAYLDLLRAYQQQAIARETLDHSQQLADVTAAYARAGQGAQADADRARAELVVRQNEAQRADEATRVASVRLVELLSLDPSQFLAPCEPTILPVELVSADDAVGPLIARGLSCRPELGESRQLVGVALRRMQREQYAMWLPSVILGASYSEYGSGHGADIEASRDRVDFDAIAYWEVRSLGVGECAAREETRARMRQAECRQVQVMDRVAREVAEAHTQVRARRQMITISETGIQAAIDSYTRNYQRIREGQGLPIEVLQSIQALDQARREYLRAVADYDESQFRLYRAIGCGLRDQAELSR